jgi:uncharacterized protein YjgD (DUF1641 family)
MIGNGAAYPSQQERIQAKLADPRTADAIERLLDKLDLVAFGVEAVDSFIRRGEEVSNSLASSIRELKNLQGPGETAASDFVSSLPQLARAGTQVAAASQRPGFQNLLESGLIDQLGDPRTIASIQTVLGKMELAAFALTALDSFIERGDQITESVREGLKDAQGLASSIDFARMKPLLELMDHLPALLESGALEQLPRLAKFGIALADSGIADPESLAAVKDCFEAARKAPHQKTSIFGLIGALNDPHVNRSVTLALEFAREYGKRI